MIPHCLVSRLTDGGKVVRPTHRSHFTPQKHYLFYVSDNHFCQKLGKPQGLVRPEGLGKFKNSPHICCLKSLMVYIYTYETI
jgi:hypothetical protein